MKKKNKLLSLCIILAIVFALLPTKVYVSLAESIETIFDPYSEMTEDEIYKLKRNDSAKDLIKEIKFFENGFFYKKDGIFLLPFSVALIEKAGEFSQDDLIELIHCKDNGPIIIEDYLEMYRRNNYDFNAIVDLLDDEKINVNNKAYLVSIGNFDDEQLVNLINKRDDDFFREAIVVLASRNPHLSYVLSKSILGSSDYSKRQLYGACNGISIYYRKSKDWTLEQKNNDISFLKSLYEMIDDDDYSTNSIIFTLSEICDFETLNWIIMNDSINDSCKAVAVYDNVDLLINEFTENSNERNLELLLSAANILPVVRIGEVLMEAIEEGIVLPNEIINKTIQFCLKEGV